MKTLKSMSINRNLMVGLAAIIVFFIVQAIVVLAMGRYTEQEVVAVARKNTVAQVELAELSTLAQQIRRYEKEYFIYVDTPEKRTQYKKEWTDAMAKIVAVLGRMRTNADGAYTTDDSIAVSKWWSASEFYNSEMSKVFAEVDSRAKLIEVQAEQDKAAQEAAAAAVAVKTVKPKDNGIPQVVTAAAVMITPVHANDMIKAGKDRFSADLIKGVAEKFSVKSKETLALTDVTNQGFNQMIYGVLASVVIGIAIGMYLLIILPRSVSGPILQLTKKVDALSRGEDISMSEEVKVLEFKGLSASVERMRTAQELMMQRLKKNS